MRMIFFSHKPYYFVNKSKYLSIKACIFSLIFPEFFVYRFSPLNWFRTEWVINKYGGLDGWAYLTALVQKDSGDLGSHAPWVIVPVHQVVNTGVSSRAAGVDLQ